MTRTVKEQMTQQAVRAHLAWWGLRHLESDAAYFAWQKEIFTPQELATLHQHIEAKRESIDGPSAEIAFYDLTANPRSVPVLYSQRYEYYLEIGSRIVRHLDGALSVLDAGCGIGVLTTFYAQRHPHVRLLGIDRSQASIALARQRAQELGLTNVHFECLDMDEAVSGTFDLVVSTHALLQSEKDPGVPSRDWSTFERAADARAQQHFEQRTGIGRRLDGLCAVLKEQGRMLLFEKTRQLARRVPFQRALAVRGLQLLGLPEPIRYRSVEEVTDDGPLYVLGRPPQQKTFTWDESPEIDGEPVLDMEALRAFSPDGDQPLYENHSASAQQAWMHLPDKRVAEQRTNIELDGRQLHVERGRAAEFHYLYCANTYDQRQLVLIDPARAAVLESYYRDITHGMQRESEARVR
ncbi:MAG TPA: methyltransferase domain-containing protein [Nitrospira sp.]|nr:methyltransferase domain-containing protein [Nitrospira sp.]